MTVLSDEEVIDLIQPAGSSHPRMHTAIVRAVEAAVIAKLDAKHLAMEEALAEQYAEREVRMTKVLAMGFAEIIMEGKFAIKHDKNLTMQNGRPDYAPLQCVLQFSPEKQRTILDRYTAEAEFDASDSEILITVTRK